jgi:hypothetical protein
MLFGNDYSNIMYHICEIHFTKNTSPNLYICNTIIKTSKDFNIILTVLVGQVAPSVKRLVTGSTVRGSNPGGGEIFRTCPDRPWGPPNLLYNGYRVFPGGRKRPGRDADLSPPSSAEV